MRVNITGNNTLAFCLFNLESLSSHSDLVWMQGCLTLNGMAMRILAIQLVIKGEVFRVELRLESEVDRYCTVVTRSFLATQTKLETVNMFSKLLSPFTKQNAVRSEEAEDFLKSSG